MNFQCAYIFCWIRLSVLPAILAPYFLAQRRPLYPLLCCALSLLHMPVAAVCYVVQLVSVSD